MCEAQGVTRHQGHERKTSPSKMWLTALTVVLCAASLVQGSDKCTSGKRLCSKAATCITDASDNAYCLCPGGVLETKDGNCDVLPTLVNLPVFQLKLVAPGAPALLKCSFRGRLPFRIEWVNVKTNASLTAVYFSREWKTADGVTHSQLNVSRQTDELTLVTCQARNSRGTARAWRAVRAAKTAASSGESADATDATLRKAIEALSVFCGLMAVAILAAIAHIVAKRRSPEMVKQFDQYVVQKGQGTAKKAKKVAAPLAMRLLNLVTGADPATPASDVAENDKSKRVANPHVTSVASQKNVQELQSQASSDSGPYLNPVVDTVSGPAGRTKTSMAVKTSSTSVSQQLTTASCELDGDISSAMADASRAATSHNKAARAPSTGKKGGGVVKRKTTVRQQFTNMSCEIDLSESGAMPGYELDTLGTPAYYSTGRTSSLDNADPGRKVPTLHSGADDLAEPLEGVSNQQRASVSSEVGLLGDRRDSTPHCLAPAGGNGAAPGRASDDTSAAVQYGEIEISSTDQDILEDLEDFCTALDEAEQQERDGDNPYSVTKQLDCGDALNSPRGSVTSQNALL
ncbi:uncharacterized protein LOC135811893 [Sycon ciliatum]|uniref:uncharacterized protein LOC135811893 n=1 Tax=Sycon ciliatum TaxID=27933 RepID=UPI0031F71945